MKDDLDVIVIGGGIIGVCSAYYLAEQGLRVTIVEQGEIASGCSGGNAGLIVPSHCIPFAAPGVLGQGLKWMLKPESPFYIKPRLNSALFSWLWKFGRACKLEQMQQGLQVLYDLNFASSKLYEHLIEGESLSCSYRQDGWLMIYKTEQAFLEAQEEAHLLQSYNIEVKILNADETLEMESTLSPEIAGGIFFPEDANLEPAKFVKALAERLRKLGVTVLTQAEVLKFETLNRRITNVRTTRGDFQPKKVVLAAGAWTAGLLQSLGLRIPLQPAKGYSISIKKPELCPGIPLYLCEAKVAVTPLEDILRFAGTLELTGMDFRINLRRVDTIMSAVENYLGQIENLEIIEIWRGLRPCTPDGLPIIDRFPGYSNLIIATGHCMLGITLAPITGKLVSQLVCEQTPDVNLTPLSLNRFR